MPLTGTEVVTEKTKPGVVFTPAREKQERDTPALVPNIDNYNADPDISKPTASKQDRARCEILPLGYDFFVAAYVQTGQVDYPITNRGKLAASFYVIPYDRVGAFPGDGPWFFSVEGSKGTPVTIAAAAGAYAQWGSANTTNKNYWHAVHGPNGYLFEFKGAPGLNPTELLLPDITDAVSVDEAKTIRFTLKWPPTANGSLKVTDAYTGNPQIIANGTTSVDVTTADGWYDVSFVDAVNVSRYLRRYAGHLENGKISKSDPAIGLQYDEKERVYKALTV